MLNFKISRKEASPAQRELARNLRGGLPDKWGYSVSGPSYEFTKAVTDKLAMAGLTRIDKGTGPQVWSVVPSISPPPTYLSRVIGTFAKVKEAPDLQRKIDAAISSRGAVRQDMFGLDEGTPAGVRALVVGMAGRNFVANCDAKDHDRAAFLEAAGFRPKPFDASNPAHLPFIERYGNRPWVTTEAILAMNLLPWMTVKAREELKLRLAEDAKRKKDSHRNDAPEDGWTFPVPDTLPEGWKPFGFQYRGVKNALASIAMAKRGGALIGDDMGLGKAQPLDARILTPEGWRLMGDLRPGDFVIGSAGRPVQVTGVYPQGLKEIFRVTFSDGAVTECCDEHLWAVNSPVRRRRGQPNKVAPLADLRQHIADAAGNRRHYIPMVAPVDFAPRDFPLDPYLLGVLLGDGCIKHHYVQLSTMDQDLVREVEGLLPDGVQVKKVETSACDYRITGQGAGKRNPIISALRELGLMGKGSDDKFVPSQYLLGSIDQRVSLLQGLLDTDGYISQDNVVQFSSNSLALAAGVADIVQSLGGNARRSCKTSASHKDHYLVTISMPAGFVPFRISRRTSLYRPRLKYLPARALVSAESIGFKEARCIAVDAPDHLYVTDDYILTHNTIQAIGVLSSKPDYKRVLIVCKSNMKEKWKSEIQTWMARGEMPEIGIWSGRDTPMPDTPFVIVNYEITPDHMDELHGVEWDCVILDEAHNVTNEEAQRTKALLGNDVDDLAMLPIREGGALLELTGTLPSKIERLWPLVSRARPDIFGSGYQDRLRFMNRYAPANLIAKTFRKTDHRGKESEFVRLIPIETTPMRMAELQIRLRASGALTARLKEDMDGILPPTSRFPGELPFRFTEAEIDELKALEGDIEKVMDRISLDVGLEGLAAVADPAERARRIIDIFDTKMEEIKGRPEFYEISRLRARIGLIKAPYVARYVIDETLGDEDIDLEFRPKTVIYAHHADVISRIRDELEEQFPGSTIVYDGKVTTDAKRKKLVDQFQNDNRKRFFIMSQSGATGITLTRACRLYVAETDWDPQNAAQIEDRIWRIGQMLPVLIGYMYVPGSYDLHVGMTVMRKMEITMRLYHDLDLSGQGIPSDQRKKKAQPAPEGVEPA